MNYAEWLEKAKDEINKLEIGAIFQISELFQSYEWNKLSAKSGNLSEDTFRRLSMMVKSQ